MRPTALICLIVLSACAEWPDAGGPPMARSSEDWPVLLPLDRVVESGTLPAATDDDANRLRNRADALRRRAAGSLVLRAGDFPA